MSGWWQRPHQKLQSWVNFHDDPKSPAKMIQQAKHSRNEMKSATEKKARKKVVDAKRKAKESGD